MERKSKNIKIERIYVPYWYWEEFLNGMYSKSNNEESDLIKASKLIRDHLKYGNAMREVINKWPFTMSNSLTNTSINRRAFLGQCAVFYKLKIPEHITRMAWSKLTENQKHLADEQAQKLIDNYEKKNLQLYLNLGE